MVNRLRRLRRFVLFSTLLLTIIIMPPSSLVVAADLCEPFEQIDITHGEVNGENDTITMDGIVFTRGTYFSKDGLTWGCKCMVVRCVQKCCGDEEALYDGICQKVTETADLNDFIRNNISLSRYSVVDVPVSCFNDDASVRFLVDPGYNKATTTTLFITNDVDIIKEVMRTEELCLDYFDDLESFGAIVCMEDPVPLVTYSIGTRCFFTQKIEVRREYKNSNL